jgi:LPXTG-motif cell wall-anchored protein
MRKLLSALTIVAFPLLFVGAAHAGYEPNEPSVEVSSGSVLPGGAQDVTVQNFCPGETVTFVLNPGGVALGTAEASADGIAAISFTAPETSGTYTVVATAPGDCNATVGADTGSTTFDVAAAGPIPQTGSDSTSLLTWASIAVGLGLVLAFTATLRRRHRTA